MADTVLCVEGNMMETVMTGDITPSGSESMACIQRECVNVGDLSRSSRMKYLPTSVKTRKQRCRELFSLGEESDGS